MKRARSKVRPWWKTYKLVTIVISVNNFYTSYPAHLYPKMFFDVLVLLCAVASPLVIVGAERWACFEFDMQNLIFILEALSSFKITRWNIPVSQVNNTTNITYILLICCYICLFSSDCVAFFTPYMISNIKKEWKLIISPVSRYLSTVHVQKMLELAPPLRLKIVNKRPF